MSESLNKKLYDFVKFNEYEIGLGLIPEIIPYYKFGRAIDISTTEKIVWRGTGQYVLNSTASILDFTSGAGNAGAELIIDGLDENWERLIETVTLDETGAVSTVGTFIRVNRVASTGQNLTVDLIVTHRDGTNIIAFLEANKNITQQMVYTVPLGYIALITDYAYSVNKGQSVKISNYIKENGNAQILRRTHEIYQSSDHSRFKYPVRINGKNAFYISAISDAGGIFCSAETNFLLIKEEFLETL